MGEMGSGRHWHFGAKDTTIDYRTLDVRRWKQYVFLTPGQVFGWQWSRHDELVTSIRIRTEEGRIMLIYRHRNHGRLANISGNFVCRMLSNTKHYIGWILMVALRLRNIAKEILCIYYHFVSSPSPDVPSTLSRIGG